MLGNIVFGVCAVLWWVAFFSILPGWRKKFGDFSFRMLLVAFACKGIALLLANSTVLADVDRAVGVPNIAILLQHLTGGLAFTAAVLTVLVYWSYPPERARRAARIRVAACGGAAIVLITLWTLAASDLSSHSLNYLVNNADRPLGAAYLIVYVVMLGVGLIETARLCWRCAKNTRRQSLRLSLRLTAVGSAIYLVHPANRAASVVTVTVGLNPLRWEPVSIVAIGTGTVLVVLGLSMPVWERRISSLFSWLESYRTYRKIRPLWLALYDAVPEIALESPNFPVRDIRYHLYRTVIEIRDGWRAMHHDLDPEIARQAAERGKAAGWSGLELRAFVESEQLKAALDARRSGRKPDVPHPAPCPHLSENFASELDWLTRIAEAFGRPE
jgi:hypothetical protein